VGESSVLSLVYVEVPVAFTVNGVVINPTADVVQLAFPSSGVDPVGGDWVTGTWEAGGPPYVARLLVGPGGAKVLAKGRYDVWVKIVDAPEIPAMNSGSWKIS
jgi:hypothetical protein